MDERGGWWWAWMPAAVLAAAPAGAQPDGEWRPDTLGIAADATPLPLEEVRSACDVWGLRVLRDTADLRAIEHFPGCEPSAFPALGKHLYVHLVTGICGGRDRVEAHRSDSRREYRVVLHVREGCRGVRLERLWTRLPPLPEGWTVAFTLHTTGGRE